MSPHNMVEIKPYLPNSAFKTIRDNNPKGIYNMQKVIDWYFLIVSCVITIMSFCFCIQDNNWGNILLFCFSIMVSILYIINILKTSAFFRLFVVCVSVLLSVIMAFILPIAMIIATYRYETVFYLAICFCILNIILSLCMKTEVQNEPKSQRKVID